MIKKKDELRNSIVENAKGGVGEFHNSHILEVDDFMKSGRIYAVCRLAPGDSVGNHTHTGESEIYHILSGVGTIDEDGVETVVSAGDVNIVPDGGNHGIRNTGTEDLVFVALILYNNLNS